MATNAETQMAVHTHTHTHGYNIYSYLVSQVYENRNLILMRKKITEKLE